MLKYHLLVDRRLALASVVAASFYTERQLLVNQRNSSMESNQAKDFSLI
jgi:hypothetical protein